ncbi:MAG TPA: PAS domain S-box protein [Tepidisphaeraceae bacterium]|jgi:PAS domain S-box-containing protein|nr:PAS domain S-box protein [Tepidisphaeraceae bacterium]
MSPDELQARMAAIVASSYDAIVSKDLNGIVKSWNHAAERIFGFTADEMIGQSITKIVPPERIDEEPMILQKLRRGEHVDHFETIRVRKDGRRIDISVTISPVRDATGQIIGASKIARDITDLKRSARERERLHELGKAITGQSDLHTLVQLITDAATELSRAQFGAFFYNVLNEHGVAYTLYTLSGVPREHFDQFPMPRNTAVFKPTFDGTAIVRSDDITKDPRYGHNEPHYGMPKGHLPVRSYLAVPVMSGDGAVLGGLFFGHSTPGVFDAQAETIVAAIAAQAAIVIENARLHRELKTNEAQFRQLSNSIPQLAWMARPDGSITWYNDRWYEYTGTTPEDQEGWGWQSVHDPKELPRVTKKWKDALAAGTPWEDTFPLRRHDGIFRWHLSRAQPFYDDEGKIKHWFGTNTDITAQLELTRDRDELLNAERAARSEAERVSRMKDEFLATLSHELRTPLNAILGWSQLLRHDFSDTKMLGEGIAVIERNARAQTQLIEDLLDMSRIVSGRIRLDVQRVDLAVVVDSAIESIKPSADAKEIQIRRLLDPLACSVAGDPNRLQQVVWNLLSNAVKFTPKGGKIEILLERVNSHVELTVTDTGQGITPDFLPYVFDRFRQADSSTSRKHGGLGLGLAIVKQLVELHGGIVRVKSAGQGQGSSFSIALPVVVIKHDEQKREHPSSSTFAQAFDYDAISLKGVKVLVVDDEEDARELIRRLLTAHHAIVHTAHSAPDGLEKLKSELPGVLISDIGMPSMDGYQFIREVRNLPPDQGGKTPAVALTAFARSEDRTRAMMAGYQIHISKPVEPHELIATVASLAGLRG